MGIALAFGALVLPRSATPDSVPLPAVNVGALNAALHEDQLRAEAGKRGLPDDVREFGSLIRSFNHLEVVADDATPVNAARNALDKALGALIGKDPERLRVLRAVETESFLAEVRAFEKSGAISDELVALSGPFVTRMRAVGWCRGNRVLLSEAERRVAYKMQWNGVAGVDRRPEFALSLDETRVLYGLYFRLPHAAEPQLRGFEAAREGAKDVAACDALTAGEELAAEAWRFERIGRFGAIDPTYPVAYAKGIAQFKMRKFQPAADSFEVFLRDHEDGPYVLKARNYLRAALSAAREGGV